MPKDLKSDEPWNRTRYDYLCIIEAGQNDSFGEYDNTAELFKMRREGLIELDASHADNRHTSMGTTLWFVLTSKGLEAKSGINPFASDEKNSDKYRFGSIISGGTIA